MDDLTVRPGLVIPAAELEVRFARSGGPGGQNVNKVNTKATLRFDLEHSEVFSEAQKARLRDRLPQRYLTKSGEVLVSSESTRDQDTNRADCRRKLAEAIREALKRPKRRVPTKPSRGARERRLKEKAQQSRKKQERRSKDW